MKKVIHLALAIIFLMTVMTQTVYSAPGGGGADVMPTFVGVIAPCPACGKASLHTCGAPTGEKTADIYCSTHNNCLLMDRYQNFTIATCTQCGFGNGEGGGSGVFAMHVQTYRHSLTGVVHNSCVYSVE